jgi:hypothetical protein
MKHQMDRLIPTIISALACASAACDDSVVEVGVIEFHNDPVVIQVPGAVKRGESALVRITTYGGGCVSMEDTEISATGDGVVITPYDRRKSGTCTHVLLRFGHEASVSFDTLGPKTVLVNGRRMPEDELIQLPFTMTVVE